MSQCGPAFGSRLHACGGPPLGELSGGNWMGRGALGGFGPEGPQARALGSCPRRDLLAHPGAVLPRGAPRGPRPRAGPSGHDSYLVDSASSHMLVSKIKPCMSKYKQSIR